MALVLFVSQRAKGVLVLLQQRLQHRDKATTDVYVWGAQQHLDRPRKQLQVQEDRTDTTADRQVRGSNVLGADCLHAVNIVVLKTRHHLRTAVNARLHLSNERRRGQKRRSTPHFTLTVVRSSPAANGAVCHDTPN